MPGTPIRLLASCAGAGLALVSGVPSAEAALPTFRVVVVGGDHTCGITTAGGVRCWGRNDTGQIGDGTREDRYVSTPVAGLSSGVASVSVGGSHTCAVMADGGVRCWGRNSKGQLGDGTRINRLVPTVVPGLSGIAAVRAGGAHTCAVTTGGQARCWGDNAYGQLGDGTTTLRLTPVAVAGLGPVRQISPSLDSHTCAVTTAGGVKCWGLNYFGQLGDGTTTDRTRPVAVSGMGSGVSVVGAGGYFSCARTPAGAVRCWGYNASGQLGDGTRITRHRPVAVSGYATGGVAGLAVGEDHACVKTTAGWPMMCWGANGSYQLGDGTPTDHSRPHAVGNLRTGATSVTAGRYTSCAITPGNVAKCWGEGTYGKVGHGDEDYPGVPTYYGYPVTVR
ncbi:MAG: hypothetical protein V9G19_04745 [Tetrasphaera sp.]